jgi:hypothetical protein
MIAIKRCATLVTALLLISLLAATQTRNPSEEATLSPDYLSDAAHQTYVNHLRAYNAGEEKAWPEGTEAQIPPKYWTNSIKALKPLKVYLHRVNMVVVQRIENGIEEGKYILLPISSYLPHNGVDGFEYTPNPQRNNLFYAGDDVLEFRRRRAK